MNKVIGIVSYFVDDPKIRQYRKDKLIILIHKLNQLFNLPIRIVAQNYNSQEIVTISRIPNVSLDLEPKLGISGAREHLRKWFVASNYDYIILIDDDVTVKGGSGFEYLKQIDSHPDCFIEFTKSRHQLLAISKWCYSKVDYNDVEPERGEGFEDRILYNKLCKLYPEKHFKFVGTGLTESAIATKDIYSTWYKDQNVKEMLEKTMRIINNIGVENHKEE